jgi:hypothetical protein
MLKFLRPDDREDQIDDEAEGDDSNDEVFHEE